MMRRFQVLHSVSTCAATAWELKLTAPMGAVRFAVTRLGPAAALDADASEVLGRGLHSSTFWLNVSALRGMWGAFRGRLREV